MQTRLDDLITQLPAPFFTELVSREEIKEEARSAAKVQRIHSGIEAQKTVLEIPTHTWAEILERGQKLRLYSSKEIGILQIATQMPTKIPSERQAYVLLDILEKAKLEAIYQE